ncbi:unnamed protein product [Owenia fusiformis]|uniref:Ubiquitin carboxyl-terminal hydrolase n=1 Tax=Owenia fusiformis TaxID=6347 RepID=A0A8J1UUX7_OWEFU|nr:unnamed protein product [Owenia fusiformis]
MAASLEKYLSKIKAPLGGEKVYKDECAFSFDTPGCETGLYVCMSTFIGVGKKHVERFSRQTGNNVFLHMRRIKKEIPKQEDDPPAKKPTKLAIGVEGGFDVDDKKYTVEEVNSIVVLPEWTVIPLPTTDIPMMAQLSSAAIIAAESAAKAEEAAAMADTWEGEKRVISRHAANLLQLDNGVKIPPKGWVCSRCELTTNLWVNLTDGTILCGRKFWDGSGGNNHAVEHYNETKYPLAVKLGTINPDGADVYSYDEDDMVEDPDLKKHLAHFGINISAMQKTDKSMVELEIDLNQRIGEWDVIQESGSKLKPLYGPGFTGMKNLGNSCYMNSVMQVLFNIPDFKARYADQAEELFNTAPRDPTSDFSLQMAKLGNGLLSGDYSKVPQDGETTTEGNGDEGKERIVTDTGIRPQMFKTLVGRGHPEFSTKRQQDAQEYILHLFSLIERNSRGSVNPTDAFRFSVEERIQCSQSKKVRYTNRDEFILELPIPLEAATNKAEVQAYNEKKAELEAKGEQINVKEMVRPRIALSACLQTFLEPENIDDFYSSAINTKTTAQKTTKLASFPDYLLVQMKKFTIGDDWVPKKLDVSLDIPDELDLSSSRGSGLAPGEELLPEAEVSAEEPPAVQIDEAVVSQLADMGFAVEGCKRAVFHTNNTGVEAAMNWVMEHMGDPDFAAPFQVPGTKGAKASSGVVVNEEGVGMVMSMGFTAEQATKALQSTDNNVERAIDWIFSHADELDTPMETEPSVAAQANVPDAGPKCRDGPGKYKLVAFISHMGTSTQVGHYVCHILKDGRWVIFNDEKVALSEKPPKDLAYIYVYQRQ